MMIDFLFWIGLYNIFGAILLMGCHFEKIGDSLLRRFTEIIQIPYEHGPFGRMWLWWAASTNFFLGGIMVLASRWENGIQREIIYLTLITYIIMYLVMIFGAKKPKYGRGIFVTHLLWLGQISWGIWSVLL